MNTHRLGENDKGQPYIECLKCSMKSYHPMDILNLYCGSCHAFHPIPDEGASLKRPPGTVSVEHGHSNQEIQIHSDLVRSIQAKAV